MKFTPKIKLSYRSKLTLLNSLLVFTALLVVTTFFLNLYRSEKLSNVYENELATTHQLVTNIENMIFIASTVELEQVKKSRDLIFVVEDPCGPQPVATSSDLYRKALADLGFSPEAWLKAAEIKSHCASLAPAAKGEVRLFQPGTVGPKLYMPTLLAFVPARGAVGKARLLLLSLDGTGSSDGDHAFFITSSAGTRVWSDSLPEALERLLASTGVTQDAIATTAKETTLSGLSSIGRKGGDGIVAYAPLLSGFSLFSLSSERALLSSIDFMLIQSILLVCGFLFICFFFGRLFATRLTRPLGELKDAAEQIGSGNFSQHLRITEDDEISIIKTSFNVMTSKIVQLINDTKTKAMIESEINVAQQVQKLLLPPSLVRTSNHEISSSVQMAQKCGGDWWGYAEVPIPGRQPVLLLLIGDVTGHGVSSALLTAAAQGGLSVLSTFFESEHKVAPALVPALLNDPRLVLHLFNRAVFLSGGGTLAMSFFTCLLDPQSEVLHTANAGHNKPYLIDEKGKIKPLGPSGNVLGKAMKEEFPEIETHEWKKGSQVFLYTDGLIDCYEGDKNLFERKHLVRLLKDAGGLKGPALLQRIMQERAKMIKGLRAEDDVTAVVITQAAQAVSRTKAPAEKTEAPVGV